jgi:F0F1-type ATP synthase delta subunit
MDNQMDLTDFFSTKLQANDFSARLALISEQAYETGFDLEKALMEQFGLVKKDKFLTLLRDQQVNLQSAKDIKNFLEKIQKLISSIPILTLTLAFEPKESTMKALSDWFMLNLKRQFVFDFKVDSNIIAGAIINFNGKYLDFSIKPKFEQILASIINPRSEHDNQPALAASQPKQAAGK